MATGADIVNGALRKLGVKPADSAITGQEMLDAIEALNDMLIGWENSGILLGFAPIVNSAAVVRVPRGTEEGIKANLAGVLASDYSKQVSPSLAAQISSGINTILKIVSKPIDVEYPETLPVGSGNQCNDVDLYENFLPANTKENF